MLTCSARVTSSRFVAHVPLADQATVLTALFAGPADAARRLGVSRMSVWRWSHGRAPIPKWAAERLDDLARDKFAAVSAARDSIRDALERPMPRRRLTGCCAVQHRRSVWRRERGARPKTSL